MAERRLLDLGLTPLTGGNVVVTDLALDSRKVTKGTLFAALPGTRVRRRLIAWQPFCRTRRKPARIKA